jgi:hypothetical protein
MPPITARELYDLALQLEEYRQSFVLYPAQWLAYSYVRGLDWQTVYFDTANQTTVPDAPGVYAFLVQPGVAPQLNGSYIMYVGQTESLRLRYADYLREATGEGTRVRVYTMFHRFSSHLYFSFATSPVEELIEAEDALLRALCPPINSQLPADVSAPVRAFGP